MKKKLYLCTKLLNKKMIQIPIESMNLLMLNVGMACHNGDWNWKNVCSPFTRIYYVTEGKALLHFSNQTISLRAGNLYIIPAYAVHSYECTGVFNHYYLHVYEGFKNDLDVMEFYHFPTEVKGSPDEEEIFRMMCQRHPQARLPESNPQAYDNATQFTDYVQRYRDMALWEKMELRGAILMLFSRFMHEATPRIWTQDERMKRVLAHIHSNICRTLDLEELADVACITKPYLIRLFKREVGISPLQYINKKKIERAQLLLFTVDKPIKDIAYKLGFSDHSYFIRLFHKLSGITPQEYRTRMR